MLQRASDWARTIKRDAVAVWIAARDPLHTSIPRQLGVMIDAAFAENRMRHVSE
jgi:hypothetical protein